MSDFSNVNMKEYIEKVSLIKNLIDELDHPKYHNDYCRKVMNFDMPHKDMDFEGFKRFINDWYTRAITNRNKAINEFIRLEVDTKHKLFNTREFEKWYRKSFNNVHNLHIEVPYTDNELLKGNLFSAWGNEEN